MACASNPSASVQRPATQPQEPSDFSLIWQTEQSSMYADLKNKKRHKSLEGVQFFVVASFERNEVKWTSSSWNVGVVCSIPGAVITSVLLEDTGASTYDKRDLNLYNKQSNFFKLWEKVCA